MDFEENLRDEITRQYGTVYNFEKTTGINRSTIWRIDNQGIDSVSNKTKQALAYYLGLSLEGIKNHELIYQDIQDKPDWIAKKEIVKSTQKERKTDANLIDPLFAELKPVFMKLSIAGKFRVIQYAQDILLKYEDTDSEE